jgi:hypothetical protein
MFFIGSAMMLGLNCDLVQAAWSNSTMRSGRAPGQGAQYQFSMTYQLFDTRTRA